MKEYFVASGFQPNEKQLDQFELYFETLISWNEKMNLTAITDQKEVYIKHFVDSLMLSKEFEVHSQTLLDVGSGAGFPAIPLKIMFPSLQITIVDALEKRIKFLTHLTDNIGIDATLVHARAEDYIKENREHFDFVTARAVARMNVLSELCIPFVKKEGYFVAYKNVSLEEVEQSKEAITTLGGSFKRLVEYELPQNMGKRALYVIKKDSNTPNKYPRNYGRITKQPL